VHVKLGFWNRLAIVAGGLFPLVGASWLILSQREEMFEARQSGYLTCVQSNPRANCWDLWMEGRSTLGWTDWWQTVGALVLVAMVFYALIGAAVWLAKWIWRGRQVNGAHPKA
jgi:hypothetical protein